MKQHISIEDLNELSDKAKEKLCSKCKNLKAIYVLSKYNYRCVLCGNVGKLTRDHIVPLSKGGKNTIDNIQPLCVKCNSFKKDKPWQAVKVLLEEK